MNNMKTYEECIKDLDKVVYNENEFTITDAGKLHYIGTNNKPTQPVGLKDYSFMFFRCDFESIDLSHWDMSDIFVIDSMFEECINLKDVSSLKDWDLSNIVRLNRMFYRCKSLENIDCLYNWNLKNIYSGEYIKDIFNGCSIFLKKSPFKNSRFDGNSVILFGYDSKDIYNKKNTVHIKSLGGSISFYEDEYKIDRDDHIRYIGKSNKPIQPEGCTDFSYTFYNRKDLESLDLSDWNMDGVKYTYAMFGNCDNLVNLSSLKKWDMRTVITMEAMFYGCKSLKNIKFISKWKFNKIKNISRMFSNCNKILFKKLPWKLDANVIASDVFI